MSARDRAVSWFVAPAPAARVDAAPPVARSELAREVTSAAVLGRPGEAEPVAAALALALRVQSRARAAAVGVIGPRPGPDAAGGGGAAAARRLAARLAAHGFEARARGRLAWVWLDPADPELVSAARRVTLVAAPAVLVLTAPRTVTTDAVLAEQDLLAVVTAEPEGPLARLAVAGLADASLQALRPFGRSPARALARAGLRAPAPIRRLVR